MIHTAPEDPGPDLTVEVGSVADVRNRLVEARRRTRASVQALRAELEAYSDWRTWYRTRPVLVLATAFLMGFHLARLGSTSIERSMR